MTNLILLNRKFVVLGTILTINDKLIFVRGFQCILFLFLMTYISINHFESMIDLFLVYCHVKHYFEKDEVITLFDHAVRSVILNQFD